MSDINARLNLTEDCIHESHEFGATIFYNICTGERSLVPWGTMDIAGMACAILIISAVVFAIYKDLKR